MTDDTFPRQYARTRRLTLGDPRDFAVSGDGLRVALEDERVARRAKLLRAERQGGAHDRDERTDRGREPSHVRAGAPPASTVARISAQRLPHGLNLLVANPFCHVAFASSNCSLNQ